MSDKNKFYFREKYLYELFFFFIPVARYFVESAFTLVAQVHSRKITKDASGQILDVMYYLNEGVYSNFLFIPLGPEFVEPKIIEHKRSDEKFPTIIWGPTCDSTDRVCENIEMELLDIDDIMYFINMGAYTIPLRTTFNGFQPTQIVYFLSDDDKYEYTFITYN